MTTPLHSTLKRALTIEGREYVVTLTSETLKVTLKGKRRGVELAWANIVNGEAALAVGCMPRWAPSPRKRQRTRRKNRNQRAPRDP